MEPARMQHCYSSQHTVHSTQCAAKTSKAAAMKSGRPHSIRRFAEEDASNLLTVLVRSSLASNDKLLDELALRILDIGPAPKLCADSWDLRQEAKDYGMSTDDKTDQMLAAELNIKLYSPLPHWRTVLPYADQLGPDDNGRYDTPYGTDSPSAGRLISALEAFACMCHPTQNMVNCINGMITDLEQITGELNKMEESRAHRLADAYAEMHLIMAQADDAQSQAFMTGPWPELMSNWAVTLWYKMNDAHIGASHGRESLYISVAPAVGSALMHAKAPAKRTVEFLLEPLENLILYQREAAMQARQRQGSEEDPAEDVNNQLLPPPPICGLLQVKRIALLLDMYATSGLQYKHTAEVLAMLLTQVKLLVVFAWADYRDPLMQQLRTTGNSFDRHRAGWDWAAVCKQLASNDGNHKCAEAGHVAEALVAAKALGCPIQSDMLAVMLPMLERSDQFYGGTFQHLTEQHKSMWRTILADGHISPGASIEAILAPSKPASVAAESDTAV